MKFCQRSFHMYFLKAICRITYRQSAFRESLKQEVDLPEPFAHNLRGIPSAVNHGGGNISSGPAIDNNVDLLLQVFELVFSAP